jgi:transposase
MDGQALFHDLRERVVAAVQTGGLSRNQAAKQVGVGISTAINWVKRWRQTGSVAPGKKMGGHKPKAISGEHRLWLPQRIKDGDFTLRGLVAELAERGLKVDYRSVWEFVHAEKLSFKKKRGGWRTRSSRRRAATGAVDKDQDRIAPERLVFIDETWTKTNMAPLRGWAPCGQRLIAKVPHGRWKTTTFVAALRFDRIDAPCLLDGPIDGETFRTYVESVLVPTLLVGDIVSWTISAVTRAKSFAS